MYKTDSFISADEIKEMVGISKSKAYSLIQELNSELKEKGYLTVTGRVSRKYFEERFYGFSSKWFVPFDDVKYEAYNFKDGELANENKLKALADYATYKEHTPDALPKFKFNGALIKEFKEVLMPEISPLLE